MTSKTIVRHKGMVDYHQCWQQMQDFNRQRNENTCDEIWLLEHPPVFTQGLNGKPEHILDLHNIPLVKTDRGGQVTYHGPGQLIAYILFDVKRNKQGVRQLVSGMEQAVIQYLQHHQIQAQAKKEAPGVYVEGAKIAALGLRVKQGGSYHGLSFNVDMDLTPFSYINPCGYQGLQVSSLQQLGLGYNVAQVKDELLDCLCEQFKIAPQNIEHVYESET